MARTYVSVGEVAAIHQLVLEHGGGAPGLRDRGSLESAVFRPQIGYYTGVIEGAAALLESLVQNHPSVDGNQRTAFVTLETFLERNGFHLSVQGDEAYDFMIENLKRGTFRFGRLKEWLDEVALFEG